MADRIAVMCGGRIVEIAPREIAAARRRSIPTRARCWPPCPSPISTGRSISQTLQAERRLRHSALGRRNSATTATRTCCRQPISATAISCWPVATPMSGSCAMINTAHRPRPAWPRRSCPARRARGRSASRTICSRMLRASGSCRRWPSACPRRPRVVNLAAMGRQPGQYGGTVRMLIGGQSDIRLMTIYGYARLVGYDEKLELQPDILESFDVGEGPHLHLQAARGPQLVGRQPAHAGGFPLLLGRRHAQRGAVAGRPAAGAAGRTASRRVFEVLDPLTVRYTWDAPNPDFLPSWPRRSRSSLAAAGRLPQAVPQEIPGRDPARRR